MLRLAGLGTYVKIRPSGGSALRFELLRNPAFIHNDRNGSHRPETCAYFLHLAFPRLVLSILAILIPPLS